MSASLPARVDAERMVAARRSFHGRLCISSLSRLKSALANGSGEVEYELEFGTERGTPFLDLHARAHVALECQRTLETFEHPLKADVRLGLITDERDEAALPGGFEPLLLEQGALRPAQVIEDELLLALPPFPVQPGSGAATWNDAEPRQAPKVENPFAALREWKRD